MPKIGPQVRKTSNPGSNYNFFISGILPNFPNALCAETDPEVFFPEKYKRKEWKVAKQVCIKCIHRIECLEFAMDEGINNGVWGGTSPVERYYLRKLKKDQGNRRAS